LWEQIPTVVTQLPTIQLIYAILFLPVLFAAGIITRRSSACHKTSKSALGAYLGSLIIAILGIVHRRREAAIKEELLNLRGGYEWKLCRVKYGDDRNAGQQDCATKCRYGAF
jgi:hypothetical protein